MTTLLFPEFIQSVNPISVGSRTNVQEVHDLLRKASKSGGLATKFYSIVDMDSGNIERGANANGWDRYHIENYLLEPKYILMAIQDIDLSSDNLKTESAVLEELRYCALDQGPRVRCLRLPRPAG